MTAGERSQILQTSLAAIVTDDPRTADVFDRFGLDYCCHGSQSLQEAVIDRHLPISDVVDELVKLGPAPGGEGAGETWADLRALTHYIVEHHHAYARSAQPRISAWLDKLVARHGARHPELQEIRTAFAALASELTMHMVKEESILFPHIDALADAYRSRGAAPRSPFGTVLNPIRVMEHDHREAGELLERLRFLTSDYTPPPDACTTYTLCYKELATFESDLHRHVHLENNVLFPGAVSLEEGLA